MIPVYQATPESFDALVLEPRGELVVLYFWGPDCPNCEFFASRLPAVLEELGDVAARLVKVNAYEHDALATRFALYGIPQFFLYRDGKRLGKMSEFRGDAFFVQVIRDQLVARLQPQALLSPLLPTRLRARAAGGRARRCPRERPRTRR